MRWGSLKTAITIANAATKAFQQKVSKNTGGYQLFNLANRVPVAISSGTISQTNADGTGSNGQLVSLPEAEYTVGKEISTIRNTLALKQPQTKSLMEDGHFALLQNSSNLRQHKQSRTENMDGDLDPGRHTHHEPNKQIHREPSASCLRGIIGLFSDQSPSSNTAIHVDKIPIKRQGKDLDGFIRDTVSPVCENESFSDDQLSHVAMESRQLIKFRDVATGIMIWTIFLKHPRLPARAKFRHAALLVLKFIKLQKHFMPAKQLYSKRAGLKKNATWAKMRDFFQGAKTLKTMQPLKWKKQPSAVSMRSEFIASHNDSSVKGSHSKDASVSNYQLQVSQHYKPQTMDRLYETIQCDAQNYEAGRHSRLSDIVSSCNTESVVTDFCNPYDERTSDADSKSLDATEALRDWLSAQTDVLNTLPHTSQFYNNYNSQIQDELVIDGNDPHKVTGMV